MLHFMGIGAQKAGTTWLYRILLEHPYIAFPAGKEVHFWNGCYDRGLEWYNSLFPEKNNIINGDITPAYGFLPKERIAEIYSLYPELQLIYLVRNPVDRAWSSALMALKRAEMTIDEASDQWFIDHFTSKGSLARGSYATCLDNWLRYFPEDQLLLLQYEDIAIKPEKVITDACHHLGLNPAPLLNNPMIYQKIHAGTGHPIRPQLKAFLEELYAEKNIELARKYGIDYAGVLA